MSRTSHRPKAAPGGHAALWERIRRTVAAETRFDGFRARLATRLGVSPSDAETLLRTIRSDEAWRATRRAGVRSIRTRLGGREIVVVEVVPGTEVPLQPHADPELAFCIQGTADQGNGSRLEVGDAVVSVPAECHPYRSVGDVPCILVLVRLRRESRDRGIRSVRRSP